MRESLEIVVNQVLLLRCQACLGLDLGSSGGGGGRDSSLLEEQR